MDTRKIEAFTKVFEHNSFSKAGRALFLSQPTISAHVAALEEELGVQLFDRIGRTVVPTKAGEILYHHAKNIFESSELAISEIRKLENRVVGKLDIGASTIPANYLLPKAMAEFYMKYPEVTLDLSIGDTEEIVTMVKGNFLMLGLVGGLVTSQGLIFLPVLKDSLVLVMAHDLYQKYAHLSLHDLMLTVPWVVREEGSGTRQAAGTWLNKVGLSFSGLREAIIVRNAGVLLECVRLGMGAAITSYVTVRSEIKDGSLVSVDIGHNSIERQFYIVYNKKRTLLPAAQKLIKHLQHNLTPIKI
ncbi:MAG: selenium metabolism-associated LysR family transcriptional regulator [Desulfomicrobium sp.]|nr:selenium metabolism-associated LysR family transcriptional regulator [Desulfomicrobium sp.]